jgi:hypothetical protein
MNALVKYALPAAALAAGCTLCVLAMRRRKAADDSVDLELEDSFPASDPPSWTRSTSTVPIGTGLD